MSDTERKKRTDLERDRPRRDPAGAFGDAGRTAFDGLRAAGEAWREVVERSVKMGYRVVEEQIEQGRKVATSLNDQVYGSGRTRDDVGDITDRVFASFADMTSRWFDMMGSMAAGMTVPGASTGGATGRVTVSVATARAAKVTLEVEAGAGSAGIEADALAPSKGDARLAVEVRPGGGGVHLEVRVPSDAPAGTYRGTLRARGSGTGVGSLQVRLGA
ncbi:MAG: hypothetical protein R2991_11165 [Thermoanaerobaculia bacterium]